MLTLYGVAAFDKETDSFKRMATSGRNHTPCVYTTEGSAKRQASCLNNGYSGKTSTYKVILLYCGKVLDI